MITSSNWGLSHGDRSQDSGQEEVFYEEELEEELVEDDVEVEPDEAAGLRNERDILSP